MSELGCREPCTDPCKFCGSTEPRTSAMDADVCEECWYGMRLEPEEFEERMRQLGVRVVRRPMHFPVEVCGQMGVGRRAPFVLALRLVKR